MQRFVLAAMFPLMLMSARTSEAAVITYSYSGLISPQSGTDPWALGSTKSFSLTFTLDQSTAVDANTGSIAGAQFLNPVTTLVINGVTASSVTGAFVNFIDGAGDSISFTASNVVLNGVSNPFSAAANLPTSAFTFTNLIETPPVFGSVNTVGGVGFTFTNYTASVSNGSLVQSSASSSVPEPATLIMFGLGALGSVGAALRRRKRAA